MIFTFLSLALVCAELLFLVSAGCSSPVFPSVLASFRCHTVVHLRVVVGSLLWFTEEIGTQLKPDGTRGNLALNSDTWERAGPQGCVHIIPELIPCDCFFDGNDSGSHTLYVPFLPHSSHLSDWSTATHHLYSWFLPRANLHFSGLHISTVFVTAPFGVLSTSVPAYRVLRCI